MRSAGSHRHGFTSTLLAGISLGTIALVQIGCAPDEGQGAGAAPAVQTAEVDQQLCQRALQTRDYRDVERLLATSPNARCMPGTLAAMPAATLAQVSPRVLGTLPRAARNRIPATAAVHLNFPATTTLARAPAGQGSS